MKTKALKKLLTTLMALINSQLQEIEKLEIAEITNATCLTFETAKEELAKLADGAFYKIEYSQKVFSSGRTEPECTVYIDGYDHIHGTTWEGALNAMRIEMQKPVEILSEQVPV